MRIAVVLLLAGCAVQPRQDIYQVAQNECRNYGFTPGTENFGACVQREVQSRRDMALRMFYGR